MGLSDRMPAHSRPLRSGAPGLGTRLLRPTSTQLSKCEFEVGLDQPRLVRDTRWKGSLEYLAGHFTEELEFHIPERTPAGGPDKPSQLALLITPHCLVPYGGEEYTSKSPCVLLSAGIIATETRMLSPPSGPTTYRRTGLSFPIFLHQSMTEANCGASLPDHT